MYQNPNDGDNREIDCEIEHARPALCVIIVLIVSFILSWGAVEPTEFGLRYNGLTKTIDKTEVYQGGLHFVGFFNSFIRFPSTMQNIEFSGSPTAQSPPLALRTKEGLALTLYISFQYRIISEQVPQLYQMANIYYEPVLIQNSRAVLLRAASEYNASAYWEERHAIGVEMLDQLQTRLAESHAFVTQLQLLVIELPDRYEDSIVSTQVQKQMKKTREMEQAATRIRAETTVKVAEYNRRITVLVQGGQARKKVLKQLAEASAAQARIDMEAKAGAVVKDTLALTPQQLLFYQRNAALIANTNSTIIWGMDNANLVLNGV